MEYLKNHEKDHSLIIEDGLFWAHDNVEMECVYVLHETSFSRIFLNHEQSSRLY
jgi:hypothetical protein